MLLNFFFRIRRTILWWFSGGVPQQKRCTVNIFCVNHSQYAAFFLSTYLVCLLFSYLYTYIYLYQLLYPIYLIDLSIGLSFYWTSFIYLHTYHQEFFVRLGRNSPQNYRYYRRGSKSLSVRNDLCMCLSSKKLVMTDRVFFAKLLRKATYSPSSFKVMQSGKGETSSLKKLPEMV